MRAVLPIAAAALLLASPVLAQSDPHAGHAHAAAPAPAAAPALPRNEAIPADAENAKEALARSPRHGEFVDLKLADGTKLLTWVVYPEKKAKAGVVLVIHEIFGLTDWVRGVADQLARDGFIALAPDLLSGLGPNGGGTEALGAEATKVIRSLTPGEVAARLDVVRDYALKLPSANGKVASVGYCWGGSMSFAYAAAQPKLDGAVVYYGSSPSDASAYGRITAPVLGLYGADDARVNATIPAAEAGMKALGKRFVANVYEGAGHGFLRQQAGREGANRKAAEQAWAATLAFLGERLGGAAPADAATLDVGAVSRTLLSQLRVAASLIRRGAEKMPEEQYGFRPAPEVRTFGQLVGHAADGYRIICARASGDPLPANEKRVEKTTTRKAELIRALDDAAAYCEAVHTRLSGAKGAEITDLFGEKQPRVLVLSFNTGHAWEHYGNVVTYLRLKGIVPPSSEPPK